MCAPLTRASCWSRAVFGWLLVLISVAQGQESRNEPMLVLNANGHTAAVNKVRFLDDDRFVTVSNDKSIRLWSVRSGESLEVLRPPSDAGPAGMLYALAVAPQGTWIAAGGYEWAGADQGVYVIDLIRREVVTVLCGHNNVILDLDFSPDGRLLASASADKTVRVWDLQTRQNTKVLRGHRDSVYAVRFAPDGKRLATASLDKSAGVWSVDSGSRLATLDGHTGGLQAVAWRADGKQLATGSVDDSIRIWTDEGRELRHLAGLGNHVTSLRFLNDQDGLYFTLGGGGARDGGFVLNLNSNRPRLSLIGHTNSVLDGALSPNRQLAATCDASGEICIWRLADGELQRRFASRGHRPWSAAWDPQTGAIAWGTANRYVSINERGPLEVAFRCSELDFVPLGSPNLPRAATRSGVLTMELTDPRTVVVRRPGSGPATLKLPNPLDTVRCYSLLDEKTAAVGADFGLFVYATETGRLLRSISGHSGIVWALAKSPDGRYLLSAGDDQTLRIWDWRAGRLLVSLFVAGSQWIAWTPEGYYAASPGGERLMGWQINHGPDRLGSFYPAAQFRNSLYHPELIRRLLDAGSVAQALNQLRADRPQVTPERLTTVEEVLPPEVAITDPSDSPHLTAQNQIAVSAEARSRSEHPVSALRLLLDGRPYEGRKGVQVVPTTGQTAGKATASWTVDLTPGRHDVAVQAETAVSKGLSNPVEIDFRPATAESGRLPDLYLLAVGIGAYPGPLRLNYADQDAELITATMKQVSGKLFREIKTLQLTNQQATRREILRGLAWLRREMTQRDIGVIFYSGHGAKDEAGNFYLVPVDGEPQDLPATGVAGSQLKDALVALPGRVLVLLDACHAGAASGDRRKAVEVITDELVRDLVTDDYGVIVMCSSMGREYSMESDEHRHGYFTVALVEALRGKADYNQDHLVYLTEIDTYLADRVKQLTGGQQHPVTTKPATIRSFPLSTPAGQ